MGENKLPQESRRGVNSAKPYLIDTGIRAFKSHSVGNSFDVIQEEMSILKELIYNPCNIEVLRFSIDSESKKYHACTAALNGLKVIFRKSKITPTKTGQFVTFWNRNENNIIQPYDINDEFDFLVVNSRKEKHFGQFIFPKSILAQQGIITKNNKEGKRAIRVYPPWDTTTSKQAQKTQKWQLEYFLAINSDNPLNLSKVKKLYFQPL